VNQTDNATKISRFYDDDLYTFVNYVMQGVSTRSLGTEAAVNYKFNNLWSVTGVASVGQTFFANNPNITIFLDNDTTQHPIASKTYIKNYYVGGGFQSAYTVGANFRPKKYNISLNVNYVDGNYVEVNPNRLTQAAGGLYTYGSPQWHAVYDQEKLPSAITVDLHVSKAYYISRKSKFIRDHLSKDASVYFSLGVYNLLNNTDIINFGFEQFRYDFNYYNPRKFPNKYIYGPGVNYLFNVNFRF
jgi:hypothetical protein